MAINTSMRSGFTGPVLLVHPARSKLCLDEDLPDADTSTFRTDGAIQPPTIKKRVEPRFPATASNAMAGRNVIIIVEAVVSKTGCVRSLRIVEQSPFPELNGAALMALSQWRFTPAYLDGKPVDMLFNLSINFKTR
jgi:TonB family protein